MTTLGEHVVLAPLLPPVWIGVAAGILAVAAVAASWRWGAGLAPRRRRLLLLLRLLVVAALAVLALRPQIRWEGRRTVPAEVVVLLDASRSMGICDAGPEAAPVTRAEAVREAFADAGEALATVVPKATVRTVAFGSRVRPSDGFAVEPTDPRTDLAEALRSVAERARRASGPFAPRPAAVVVVSDGCANRRAGEADAAARDLADAGVGVHAVVAGSAEPTGRVRDVAVRGLRAPDRVFAGNRAEVRATVATLGLKGASAEVVLSAGGKELARRTISPGAQRAAEEVVFTPTLEQVGPVRLSLAAAPLDGELVTTNNGAETTIRVEKGGIRVLYLEGRLRPEGKYLARVLADAREIDLERRLLVGQRAEAAAPKPDDLDGFDVVILGDLPAGGLPPATLRRLAGRVQDGTMSVLTVGGLEAYGPGGWAGTAVADVLPFAIRSSDKQVDGPLEFRATPEGREHFVFRGDEDGAAPPLDDLPPIAGANAVGEVRPGARLLAQAEDGTPLLAVRTLGDGRVASAAFDTTWQWALAPAETGGPAMHEHLWRRLVLWLARRDGRPHDDLWITTDRTQYVVADPDRPPEVEVTVGVRGETRPSVRFEGPAGVSVSLARRDGSGAGRTEWRGRVPLAVPGVYTVVAEAAVEGEAKWAETHLAVREQDFELTRLLADTDRLKAIAGAGGGSCRPLDGLPDVLTQVAASLEPRKAPAERRVRLARGRAFLGVFIALMAAEWVLRRRWGLA
jgi:uncharacterized membrane protein